MRVTWEGQQDLTPLEDRKIRLKFVLSNVKLYSYKIKYGKNDQSN